jgi:hypothetical protein
LEPWKWNASDSFFFDPRTERFSMPKIPRPGIPRVWENNVPAFREPNCHSTANPSASTIGHPIPESAIQISRLGFKRWPRCRDASCFRYGQLGPITSPPRDNNAQRTAVQRQGLLRDRSVNIITSVCGSFCFNCPVRTTRIFSDRRRWTRTVENEMK